MRSFDSKFGRKLKPHERSNVDLKGRPSQLWDVPDGEFSYQQKVGFAVLGTISGFVCDAITKVLNDIEIVGHENFLEVMNKSERDGRGLLTVMNHQHYVDDPLIHVALLKMSYVDAWKSLIGDDTVFDNWKWTPAEKMNFFHHRNELIRAINRWFFGMTKTVPILRGQGIEQESFEGLIDKLNRGDWVSIFGEGTRSRDGELGPFKPGTGALISASHPLVMAIGHDGLKRVSPMGSGQKIVDPVTGKPMRQMMQKGKKIHVVVDKAKEYDQLVCEVPKTPEGYMVISNEVRKDVAACFSAARANAEAAMPVEGWSERSGLLDLSSVWKGEMR